MQGGSSRDSRCTFGKVGGKMSDRRGIRSLRLVANCSAALIFAPVSFAQDGPRKSRGWISGGYNIQQTIEFGYRANEINGNMDTYDTFVNLGSGVRLFDYSLEMRSINHNGLLFDNLTSATLVTAAIRTMYRGCASKRTSGTTFMCCFAATRISGTTTCSPIR